MSRFVTNFDLANGIERVMTQTLNTMIEVDGVRSAQLGVAQNLARAIVDTYGPNSPQAHNAVTQYGELLSAAGSNMEKQMNTRYAMAAVHDHVLGIDSSDLSGGSSHLEFTKPVELAQGIRFADATSLAVYADACKTRDVFAETTMKMLAPVANNDAILTGFVSESLPLSRMQTELANGQKSRAEWAHTFSDTLFPLTGEVPITAVIFTAAEDE